PVGGSEGRSGRSPQAEDAGDDSKDRTPGSDLPEDEVGDPRVRGDGLVEVDGERVRAANRRANPDTGSVLGQDGEREAGCRDVAKCLWREVVAGRDDERAAGAELGTPDPLEGDQVRVDGLRLGDQCSTGRCRARPSAADVREQADASGATYV